MSKRIHISIEQQQQEEEEDDINHPILELSYQNMYLLSINLKLINLLKENNQTWILTHSIWKHLIGEKIDACSWYSEKNNYPELILDDDLKGFILLSHYKYDKPFNCDIEIYFAITNEIDRNKGIMKVLIKRLKDKYSTKSIWLKTDDENKLFWEKMGFTLLKTEKNENIYLFNSDYIEIPLTKFKVEMPYGCDYNEETNKVEFHNREYNNLGSKQKVLRNRDSQLDKHMYFYVPPHCPLNSLDNFQKYEKLLRKFKNYNIIQDKIENMENPYNKLIEYLYCIKNNN